MQAITLNNGQQIPMLGLGTWKSEPGEVRDAVLAAVRAGYRHIDCAWIYQNEAEIGEALAELFDAGEVTRDELWITSKLWNNAHAAPDVAAAINNSLHDLRLDCLDLYLIHWPAAQAPGVVFPQGPSDLLSAEEMPLSATWAAMEALVDGGLCKAIGVSNFGRETLQTVLAGARIMPAVNQVELHPYLQQSALLDFCRHQGIAVTAYSPLGSRDRPAVFKRADEPVLLEDDTVVAIAASHGCCAAQILLAWALSRDTIVIPKSVNPARIRQNLEADSITLSAAEKQRLSVLERQRRYVDGSFLTMPGSPYTQSTLWR